MSANPYQPSATGTPFPGCPDDSRDDLRRIARHQQQILLCFVVFFLVGQISWFDIDTYIVKLFLSLAGLLIVLTGMTFACILAVRVYGKFVGGLLGLLMFVPVVGLLGLLVVNRKATSILRKHGIKVGFYGADPAGV